MNTQDRVNEKIAKVALKNQEIELAVVDNLRAYAKSYSKYENEGKGLISKAERLKAELKELKSALYKWAEVGDSIADDIIKDLKQFEKMAKDLGFNVDTQIDYANASDAFTKYASAAQKYEKMAKEL
tara:strand:+ start:24 stop:404 length:381 start_codon:yes stop_codon:yes gene_type:complete